MDEHQLMNSVRNLLRLVRFVNTGREPLNLVKHSSDASLTEFMYMSDGPFGRKVRFVPGFKALFAVELNQVTHQSAR
jgi:hypothetical protein